MGRLRTKNKRNMPSPVIQIFFLFCVFSSSFCLQSRLHHQATWKPVISNWCMDDRPQFSAHMWLRLPPTDTSNMCILHLSYENIDMRRNLIFFRKMDSRPPFCSNVIKILICIVCLAVELQLALWVCPAHCKSLVKNISEIFGNICEFSPRGERS